jgi:MoCo/4Fe-4S cofactor protein with predicted Tat translocation signal
MSQEEESLPPGGRPGARFQGLAGREYWRSLEELARTEEFQGFLESEFPRQASRWDDEVSRRSFLRLMAASLGVAGVTGCTRPPEQRIVPYVVPPEQVVPGKPLFFATAMPWAGYARGVLVETHEGRPTKVEGNPAHPSSLGAADAVTQASILDLWDPDRAQVVSESGQISTWGRFLDAWSREAGRLAASGGKGLRILTESVTSPTLLDQLRRLLARYPEARWSHYQPVGRDSARRGAELAFGRPVDIVYRLDRAERIVSLDADFLLSDPGSLRYAREFADRRRVRSPVDREGRPAGPGRLEMSRFYMVESTPTTTGAMADHRVVMSAGRVAELALALAARLGLPAGAGSPLAGPEDRWVAAAAADLKQHPGSSLVIAGADQPPLVHALAHAMNGVLGGSGKTAVLIERVEGHPKEQVDSLKELVREMEAGEVESLFVLGGNPILNAPADLWFEKALSKVKLRVHQSLHYDETSFHCHWHLPEAHSLEGWSDARAHDGSASIIQPVIAPLYQGRSVHQVVALLLGERAEEPLVPVRDYWRGRFGADFERLWEESLRRGVIEGSAHPPLTLEPRTDFLSRVERRKEPGNAAGSPPADLEVIFRPDPTIGDGRYANNGWLQELPKPLTRLTWDNAALLSPATARKAGVESGQLVLLRYRGREVKAPVWVLPGQPDGSVTIHLGYGRERAGRVGTAVAGQSGGFNGYLLRVSEAPGFDRGLELTATSGRYPLASTQLHQILEGPTRDLVRVETIARFAERTARGKPAGGSERGEEPESRRSLYPDYDYSRGHRWAMEIDNNSCIGCNACVVACQAENNIPIVGKNEVLNAREMHWIRIDTYFAGSPEKPPETYFEPLPCMHCEKAPCEPVCPVGATTHSVEGLNEMTYNRCVGTRYCSNNCPYKVRRFNFFQYSEATPGFLEGRNPEVTVRDRGVMEKCTYCVQRIDRTRIEIKKMEVRMASALGEEERRELRRGMDQRMGDLQTACAQACPTRAITFGDLNWQFQGEEGPRPSEVKRLRLQPQDYGLLTHLNTEPRTRYLPRFRNPSAELEPPAAEPDTGGPRRPER